MFLRLRTPSVRPPVLRYLKMDLSRRKNNVHPKVATHDWWQVVLSSTVDAFQYTVGVFLALYRGHLAVSRGSTHKKRPSMPTNSVERLPEDVLRIVPARDSLLSCLLYMRIYPKFCHIFYHAVQLFPPPNCFYIPSLILIFFGKVKLDIKLFSYIERTFPWYNSRLFASLLFWSSTSAAALLQAVEIGPLK